MKNQQATIYRALECRPDSFKDWYQQGNTLRDRGRYWEALASYEKALEYEPRSYWVWYWRITYVREVGRQHRQYLRSC
ncbi:Tetratricopeptide TPR_1 repeat-containing protein [Crinalium epipsammum PCC 9333]|uniref:Tetratricopeptide TPR_1 repeat-containing protein n=1 Tax=Crinalium epipsammum PCC 9333 TaxID=1173022 RepID=K9W2Y4_9CYAN|nr:tetratricopeptide repeat protein [Crinalium epipsammum]AFZ13795.1 Tetratricopeptide TPR_1 repeat-containing protein [Crinalium epipsammum PCC 9333]